jgi:hypothetical protein
MLSVFAGLASPEAEQIRGLSACSTQRAATKAVFFLLSILCRGGQEKRNEARKLVCRVGSLLVIYNLLEDSLARGRFEGWNQSIF